MRMVGCGGKGGEAKSCLRVCEGKDRSQDSLEGCRDEKEGRDD